METLTRQEKRPVLTKVDFVERYAAGEFGNASPTWNSLEEWKADHPNPQGLVDSLYHIRNRVAGASTWYNVTDISVPCYWRQAIERGYHPSQLYISQMAPTKLTLFQGEVQRGIWGCDLLYTTVQKPMRDALREQSTSINGVLALFLLRRFLCSNSYEWLQHLLDTYEDHVVEFSTYSVEWGTVPGYNTVFWEVRRY